MKGRPTSVITQKATLVTATDELRAELEQLTDYKLIEACAQLPSREWLAAPDAAMSHVQGSLARRWLQRHEKIKVHSRHLKILTKIIESGLVEAVGVGLDIAAEKLVTAGDNTDRVRSEAGSPSCAALGPSPQARAGPTDATGATAAATGKPIKALFADGRTMTASKVAATSGLGLARTNRYLARLLAVGELVATAPPRSTRRAYRATT